MLVNARRFIRKLRGGAQAHLIEAEDGHYYVVKFRNNPQHRRILVNELVAGVLLKYLQISCPEVAVVNLTSDFIRENPDVGLQLGSRSIPVEAGWHFGSRFPGDPNTLAVYDFIPDVLLRKVMNREHFVGVLVFDKWTGNADSRQSVFFRARVSEWLPESQAQPRKTGFVAQMMDHGYIFDGPHWTFNDSPIQGLYFRPAVYEPVRSWDDFQPWLDRIVNFPEEVLDDALKQVPGQWIDGDEDHLERLFYRLVRRRARVADLIEESNHGRANPFPNWRSR
jgi:HipA-like protein